MTGLRKVLLAKVGVFDKMYALEAGGFMNV